MKIQQILFYLLLIGIIIASFFLYSSYYYPLLSSDDALNVLMTYYYKLPDDFYCWGQNRGGTLIPLISQIFHRLLGMSAIVSVSFSNYIILILGYIGFSSLFKNNFTKVIFALIWFFPPIQFIDLTRFPLGVQYSLLGFSIYLINKIDFREIKKINNYLLLIIITIVLILSVWVSDLTIVSILLMLAVLYFNFYLRNGFVYKNKTIIGFTFIGVVSCILFINYAKSFATYVFNNYTKINSWNSFIHGLSILKKGLFKTFTFQNIEVLSSLYAWLVLFIIVILIFTLIKNKIKLSAEIQKWLFVFILDFFAIIGVIVLSKWVYVNGMGHWYFVSSYISLSVVLLILFDNIDVSYYLDKIIKYLLLLTVIVGSFSTLHYIKFITPKTFRSQIDLRREFLSLGEIGIIGDFWNSHITACSNPSTIKATPNDFYVRNPKLVDDVFIQPNLYVIRDMWLETFPDTLKQFGYVLKKDGESFRIGGCNVNKYKKIKLNEIIPLSKFYVKNQYMFADSNYIEVFKDSLLLKDKYVLWGPYMSIGIGKFKVRIKIEAENDDLKNPFALFDVVAENGKITLASEELIIDCLGKSNTQIFEVEFECQRRYRNTEFKIFNYGVLDYKVLTIHLIEK